MAGLSGASCLGSRLLTVHRTMRLISSVLMCGVAGGGGMWFLSARISAFSSVVSAWHSLRALVQGGTGLWMRQQGLGVA